jgi:hypothetical protein
VALSYAGEDRPRVGPLAEALADTWGRQRVLYDKFHDAEFARPNLDVYLPQLYRDQADLIVVVLSPDYPRKVWCGLELRWIRQLILEGDAGRIMLLALGDPGDLSQLGILRGDGTLNIAALSPAATAARVNERLAQRGAAIPSPAPAAALRWWQRRWLRVAAPAVAVGLPLALLLGRAPFARWQLHQGDEAFRAFAQVPSEERLQRAGAAWQRARQFDPGLAAAHARLGFLSDFLDEPEAAEGHWRQAVDREPAGTAAARAYRTGLAHSLARQPARQQEALEMYQADVLHPRSAIELTMLRWGRPSELPQASDAINHPELVEALAGSGSGAEPPWGFNVPPGEVVLFLSRGEQRCLLSGVRATTSHLAGGSPANPLAASGCQGLQNELRDLLCSRLTQATSNPRASSTARWLGCPPAGGNAAPAHTG